MFGNRLTRYVVMAALILAGVSFIALIMSNFDTEADTIISELLAVFILLAVLIGAASLAALGLRAVRNSRDRSRSKDEDEDV